MKKIKDQVRNYLALVICILLATMSLTSQSCGIRHSEHDVHQFFTSNTASIDIRTYWYIVKDGQGNGINTTTMINELIDDVVEEYSSHGINLISTCNDRNLSVIENSTLYNAEVSTSSTDLCLFDDHCMQDGLNVFLLDGNRSGLATVPGNLCFAKVSIVPDARTVIHEIGHCLGLWHTSHGRPYKYYLGINQGGWWECDETNVDYHDRPFPSCDGTSFNKRIKMELVDGSNSTEAGDFVTDTPADIAIHKINDPVFGDECEDIDACSNSTRCEDMLDEDRKRDPNCQDYNIDWDNFMRPYITDCENHFTEGQIKRMKAITEFHLQYMIIGEDTPQLSEIDCPVSEINLNTLHIGEIPTNVTLQWSTDGNPADGIAPILDPNITTSGEYFAYYYFINEDCHGPASLPIQVTLQETIPVVATQASNNCPEKFVDLNSLLLNQVPENTEIIWLEKVSQGQYNPLNDNIARSSGTYAARYHFLNDNCFGPISEDILIILENCCDFTDDHIITTNTTYTSPMSFGGNLIVTNNSTLTIDHNVFMGQDKNIIVESGSTLKFTKSSSLVYPCRPNATQWDGIIIKEGASVEVIQGGLHSCINCLEALAGSTVDIQSIVVGGKGQYTGRGISLLGELNVVQLKRIKAFDLGTGIFCQNSNNYYDFLGGEIFDCNVGIKLESAPASIRDFGIVARNTAISAIFSPGTLIENNYLNADPDGDTHGINMWWCDASVIKNNTIGTDWKAPNSGISLYLSNGGSIRDMNVIRGGRGGIFAFGTDFSIIQNDISATLSGNSNRGALTLMLGNGNQILNNYIDAQNVTHGINTIMSSGTQIENNDITTYFGPTWYRPAAIKSEGSNGEIIENNNVNGMGNSNGILANNSSGNTYDCNHSSVEGQRDALSVLYNSQGQSVKGNYLTSSSQDLLIRSIIGQQVHQGNEFCGGNAFAESQLIAENSSFFVNSTYNCHLPIEVDPDGWFTDETDKHNFYECANDPGPNWVPFWDDETVLCSYYQRIINTYGYNSTEYIRMIQTMLRYGQQRINFDLPDCIKGDPVLPECWEKLVQAENLLAKGDDGKENTRLDLAAKVENLSVAYQSGNGESYLVAEKDNFKGLIADLSNTRTEYNVKLNQVKDLLDDIDCTDPIISVALPILDEYVRYVETDDKANYDYSTLISYSRLCADDYGPYIHLARGIVFPVTGEYFDQYDTCREGNIDPRSAKQSTNTINIYPNPSTGLVTLEFDKESTGDIEVVDFTGRIILKRNFDQLRQINMDLSSSNGVHLINIYHNDGTFEVLKHITIK